MSTVLKDILAVDVEYLRNLHKLHRDLPLLLERNKIKKCKNFVCIIEQKQSYAVHIKALKEALNHGLISK